MSFFVALETLVDKPQQFAAQHVWIDVIQGESAPGEMLTVTDDSEGVSPEGLLSMISVDNACTASRHHSGYRRSCLRVAQHALIFSKHRSNRVCSVALLSDMVDTVPMCRWVDGENNSLQDYGTLQDNLAAIMQQCPFDTPAQLLGQVAQIGESGVRLVLFGFHQSVGGHPEIDFSVPGDITLDRVDNSNGKTHPTFHL